MIASLDFNPKRLTFARRRRGLTKTKLANLLGVEVRSITAYENEEFRPELERLRKLASVLRFPEKFFEGDDLDEIVPDIVSFRSIDRKSVV